MPLLHFAAATALKIVKTNDVYSEGGHPWNQITNVTTLAEHANADFPSVLASMTKGGLASATRSLAIEYAARGVRANAVSPGITATPRFGSIVVNG